MLPPPRSLAGGLNATASRDTLIAAARPVRQTRAWLSPNGHLHDSPAVGIVTLCSLVTDPRASDGSEQRQAWPMGCQAMQSCTAMRIAELCCKHRP